MVRVKFTFEGNLVEAFFNKSTEENGTLFILNKITFENKDMIKDLSHLGNESTINELIEAAAYEALDDYDVCDYKFEE